MEDLGKVILLAAVVPGLVIGLLGGLRGGAVTAGLSASAGGICGLGIAMLFAHLLTSYGGLAREGIAAPAALIGGSIVGGLIGMLAVRRLRA